MDISIKFQILAIGILIVIMVDFLCSKKLPLISTKTFTLFWAASFFNLLADIGSYYTITHMDSVPEWLNRLMHQLFLGSLNAMVFLLFMYVWFLCGAQKRISKPVLFG
ncbi:MAG: hypothetical protein IJD85_03795, partial [Oscillospiraceae bacterium]|nr:hypothetical protein [Oscillospiraceae bacterium]